MTKKKRELEIGDNIKEIKTKERGEETVGEILLILDDSKPDPMVECAEIDPKELTLIEDAFGNLKSLKLKMISIMSHVRHYSEKKHLMWESVLRVKVKIVQDTEELWVI